MSRKRIFVSPTPQINECIKRESKQTGLGEATIVKKILADYYNGRLVPKDEPPKLK